MTRVQTLFTTVAQKPNQRINPKSGCYRSELVEESGRLFCLFFGEAKKKKEVFNDKLPSNTSS
jgi:hypothetical protein